MCLHIFQPTAPLVVTCSRKVSWVQWSAAATLMVKPCWCGKVEAGRKLNKPIHVHALSVDKVVNVLCPEAVVCTGGVQLLSAF